MRKYIFPKFPRHTVFEWYDISYGTYNYVVVLRFRGKPKYRTTVQRYSTRLTPRQIFDRVFLPAKAAIEVRIKEDKI